ncbi:MAG: M28 family metallopeptidase [Gemmataceae bacterium]
MLPTLLLSLALGAEPFPYEKAGAELSEEIRTDELKAHVYRLASPEFLGRSGPGAARAAAYIAEAFEKLKLKPAFGDTYYQPIPWNLKDGQSQETSIIGNNVVAVLPGSDPKLKDEWVLLSCHFDHLGMKGNKLFAGADDNASGCAMVLEVAERFALQKARPKRTIVFAAFDQEETGLLGSTHFAAKPPLPFSQCKVCLSSDMVGRSMGNVMNEYVFALGSESSKELRQLLEANPPKEGLKAGRIGADVIGTRSDYGPFRDKKVPYIFFSTGIHPDYHTPNDTPDRIEYEKMRKISNWVFDLTARLADADKAPTWEKNGLPPDLDEVRTVHTMLGRVLDKPAEFPLNDKHLALVKSTREKLAGILSRGQETTAERTTLLWTARLLMVTLFH